MGTTKELRTTSRRRVRVGVGTHAKAVKVAIDIPAPLYRRTEEAMRELSMNRSDLIRSAVEMFLRQREREKLEHAIADSLSANRDLDRQLLEDFMYVDSDFTGAQDS